MRLRCGAGPEKRGKLVRYEGVMKRLSFIFTRRARPTTAGFARV